MCFEQLPIDYSATDTKTTEQDLKIQYREYIYPAFQEPKIEPSAFLETPGGLLVDCTINSGRRDRRASVEKRNQHNCQEASGWYELCATNKVFHETQLTDAQIKTPFNKRDKIKARLQELANQVAPNPYGLTSLKDDQAPLIRCRYFDGSADDPKRILVERYCKSVPTLPDFDK